MEVGDTSFAKYFRPRDDERNPGLLLYGHPSKLSPVIAGGTYSNESTASSSLRFALCPFIASEVVLYVLLY
jgi:hypothetical protein